MKIYFQYDGEPKEGEIMSVRKERQPMKLKITIPSSWLTEPCSKLLNFFISNYNKKYDCEAEGHKGIISEEMYLRVGESDIPLDGIVNQNVEEYNDVFILHRTAKKAGDNNNMAGTDICTNFGCGKRYILEENTSDDACHYHAKPPVFHDTVKYWACCEDQKAPDWETFEKIQPCCRGKHSNQKRGFQQPTATINNVALSEEELRSINHKRQQEAMRVLGGNGKTGPREFEGAVHDKNAKGKVDEDGYAFCRNYGCQKKFLVAENDDETACTHHSGGPVFWDTYKYWNCCPDKKCYEFDDFVKIPGCSKGKHLH